MKKLIIALAALVISIGSLYSQNKTIKGRVISDFIETISFVSVMVNDTTVVGRTDINGFFQVEIPDTVKRILFRTAGVEPTPIVLTDKCDEIEVVMMSNSTYDFITLRKADKLRMKRFKKLPVLHKEAFEKGIFKTVEACYTQEFISYSKKK